MYEADVNTKRIHSKEILFRPSGFEIPPKPLMSPHPRTPGNKDTLI